MATLIEKNTQRLRNNKLAGNSWINPQLPYENRNPYWPQGGQQALNTISENYIPNLYGGSFSNTDVTSQGYNSKTNPIQLPGATVTGTKKTNPGFWDNTGINPNNFYNNQSSTNLPKGNIQQVPYQGVPDFSRPPEDSKGLDTGVPGNQFKSNPLNQNSNYAPAEPSYDWNTAYGEKRTPVKNLSTFKSNIAGLKAPILGGKTSQQAQDLYNNLENPILAGAPEIATKATSALLPGIGFAAQIAPMVYNMFKGMQKPEKTKPNYNPYEGQARSLMANRRFNIDPMLNSNLNAQAVTNRNIRNVANSRGEMMGNFGASQNYRMAGDSAAWAQKNNMDNQYRGEQAQMDAQLGSQRAAMDWNTQTANSQNKAATNSFLGQGFNDLGKFAQTQQLMGNQQKNSQDQMRIFQDTFGGIAGFMPEIQKMLKLNGIN